jgi:hypothetical protein
MQTALAITSKRINFFQVKVVCSENQGCSNQSRPTKWMLHCLPAMQLAAADDYSM